MSEHPYVDEQGRDWSVAAVLNESRTQRELAWRSPWSGVARWPVTSGTGVALVGLGLWATWRLVIVLACLLVIARAVDRRLQKSDRV